MVYFNRILHTYTYILLILTYFILTLSSDRYAKCQDICVWQSLVTVLHNVKCIRTHFRMEPISERLC